LARRSLDRFQAYRNPNKIPNRDGWYGREGLLCRRILSNARKYEFRRRRRITGPVAPGASCQGGVLCATGRRGRRYKLRISVHQEIRTEESRNEGLVRSANRHSHTDRREPSGVRLTRRLALKKVSVLGWRMLPTRSRSPAICSTSPVRRLASRRKMPVGAAFAGQWIKGAPWHADAVRGAVHPRPLGLLVRNRPLAKHRAAALMSGFHRAPTYRSDLGEGPQWGHEGRFPPLRLTGRCRFESGPGLFMN
jgi:hypothetical protein